MYADYSPVPDFPHNVEKVLVLEEEDRGINPDAVIREARLVGATNRDGDNVETFWVVFYNEPKRVWDFREQTLRGEFLPGGSWAKTS